MDDHVLPAVRSQLDLMTAQLEAIDAWHRARRASRSAADQAALTREMRLDLSRRDEAVRREHEALVARAGQQLQESARVVGGPARTRAVLAHRSPWLRTAVAQRLEVQGVAVVGAFEDGADAAGTIVAEQPDLVLVEDRLPTLPGIEVVRRVRAYAPEAVVGAQCQDGNGVKELLDAGAHVVLTRRVPPPELADALLGCLVPGGQPLAVV